MEAAPPSLIGHLPTGFRLFDLAPTPMSCSLLNDQGVPQDTHWNQEWLATFGYAAEDVQGRSAFEIGLWPDVEPDYQQLVKVMTSSLGHRVTVPLLNARREIRHVQATCQMLDINGLSYLMCSFIDKTEQLAREAQLREYRTMVQRSNDGMLLMENGLIAECNPAAERFYGRPREQLLHIDPLSLFPEFLNNDPAYQEARQAIDLANTGTTQHVTWEHEQTDGHFFSAEITMSPIHKRHPDEPNRFVGVMRDMTEAHRTQQALQRSADRFRKLFELAPFPLMLRSMDGTITHVNKQFERVLGYSAADLPTVADWWRQAYPDPTVMARVLKRYAQVEHEMTQGTMAQASMETLVYGKNGQPLVMLVNISKIGDQLLASYQNITEIREAHAALQSLNSELETRVQQRTADLQAAIEQLQRTQSELVRSEKLASLGALVAGIAHELNTPIGNAVMVASTLHDLNVQFSEQLAQGLRRSTLDQFLADWHEATEVIERNLQRAAELIISFKQVAVDQSSYQRRTFDLAEVLHELRLTLSPSLRRAQVELSEDVSPGLQMDSFPGPLTQVLMNVVNNAVLHAFDGRSERRIFISGRALPDSRVRLTIQDNGCGIAPHILPRVFDPFFTTKLGKGGSGLGLHIVYSLVTELLGGSVSIDSSAEHGTTLCIELPMSAPSSKTSTT